MEKAEIIKSNNLFEEESGVILYDLFVDNKEIMRNSLFLTCIAEVGKKIKKNNFDFISTIWEGSKEECGENDYGFFVECDFDNWQTKAYKKYCTQTEEKDPIKVMVIRPKEV